MDIGTRNSVDSLQNGCRKCGKFVIYTSCYDHPNDLSFVEQLEATVSSSGGKLLPVYLKCDLESLEKRVAANSRVELKKITDPSQLRNQLSKWNCIPLPRQNCLVLDTAEKAPDQCVKQIVEIFKLKT